MDKLQKDIRSGMALKWPLTYGQIRAVNELWHPLDPGDLDGSGGL